MQLSVIIPVFNEEKTIEKILTKVLKEKTVKEVIVVDDGSTDTTSKILSRLKRITTLRDKNNKLKVLAHKLNLGKGASIKTGIYKATGEYIVIQDADLEYNPSEFENLLAKASKNKVVYGSRMMGKNPHAYMTTYLGNLILTGICNVLFSTKLTDIYTCYKLIPLKIVKAINISCRGFEIEAEITAKLLKKNIEILEVPITYNPRTYAGGKKIKALDALKGILTLIRIKGAFV